MNLYSKPKNFQKQILMAQQVSPFNSTSPWDKLFKIDFNNVTPGPGYYNSYLHPNIKGASVLKNEDRDNHSVFKEV